MKHLSAFSIFFLSFCLCSNAQETIEYDFVSKKVINQPNWIKEGALVQVQYKGVNKYALKSNTSITSVNRSYDDGLSQLQVGLQQLSGEKKNADNQKTQTHADVTAPAFAHLSVPNQNILNAKDNYFTQKAVNLENIERELNIIREEVLKINSIMSMDKDITAATDDPTLNTQALIESTIFIQSGTTGIAAPADFTPTLAGSISNIDISLRTIDLLLNALDNNFSKEGSFTPAERKEEGQKINAIIEELKKRAAAIEAVYSGQNLKVLQDNAADMGRRSLKLLSQDFTIAPTVLGSATGDYVEISDKLNDNSGKLFYEIKPFKIRTYGGSRVDFSIGISVNIGGQGKYKYDLRKNPTNATSGTAVDSVILLSDDQDRLFKFSPTIFVHWYINKKQKLQLMFTSGLTPDFSEVSNSRLSIGTSLGFPSSNDFTRRLVFSAGVSLGYADVLKTKYKNLTDYRSFGQLAATDLTEKSLKAGAFVSFSYNLGGTGH